MNFDHPSIACALVTSFLGLIVMPSTSAHASTGYRQHIQRDTIYDQGSIAIGMGQEYGGIGANVAFYPIKPLAAFAGVGFNFAGLGANGGLKLRVINRDDTPAYAYLLGMYGYNAVVRVKGAPERNKSFNGFSFGIGFETNPKVKGGSRFAMSLIVPVRKPEVEEYINSLKSSGVQFGSGLLPFTISIGFRFAQPGAYKNI
jgi:hypothetical protein